MTHQAANIGGYVLHYHQCQQVLGFVQTADSELLLLCIGAWYNHEHCNITASHTK